MVGRAWGRERFESEGWSEMVPRVLASARRQNLKTTGGELSLRLSHFSGDICLLLLIIQF